MKQDHICLLGVTYNTNNYGVRVLLSGAVQSFAQANPHYAIRVLDYQRDPAVWKEWTRVGERPLEVVNLRFSWKLYLPNNIFRLLAVAAIARVTLSEHSRLRWLSRNPWMRKILEAKAHLSLAGGDSMSDIYGVRQFLYVALPQILVLLLGRPLILLPQTYGPFRSAVSRWVARYIFSHAQVICSRDRAGVNVVRQLAGDGVGPVRVIPDVGLAMEPAKVSGEVQARIGALRKNGTVVGLNVSKLLFMGGYTGRNMFDLCEDFPQMIRKLVHFLVTDLQACVLLVPHVFGESESQESEVTLCRQLMAEFDSKYSGRVGFIDGRFDHREIKGLIGQCEVFVGSRMHACIAAVSQCVPTVALAYSHKFAGVMELVGVGVRVIDLKREGTQAVCEAVREVAGSRERWRQQLELRMPAVRNEIHALFDEQTLFSSNSCPLS